MNSQVVSAWGFALERSEIHSNVEDFVERLLVNDVLNANPAIKEARDRPQGHLQNSPSLFVLDTILQFPPTVATLPHISQRKERVTCRPSCSFPGGPRSCSCQRLSRSPLPEPHDPKPNSSDLTTSPPPKVSHRTSLARLSRIEKDSCGLQPRMA